MSARPVTGELQRIFPLRWRMTREYRLPQGVLGEPYFISWDPSPYPTGEGWNGIAFHDDGVININTFRNPVQIAQYALYQYRFATNGDGTARERFLAQARYLASAQRPDGGYEYPIALPAYNAKPGFLSGMPQGEAASVLIRAYALTKDETLLSAGLRALGPLRRDVREGGASYLRDGAVCFEEVAAEPLCHILNGHLYAAFGVWEYIKHGFADDALKKLHDNAIDTLDRWIERYDVDGWSCYDLAADNAGRLHLAPLWYHQFHIAQLHIYTAMTGNDRFAAVAERWSLAMKRLDVRARVWQYGAGSLARSLRRRITGASVSHFIPK